jgi:hypothetical protein
MENLFFRSKTRVTTNYAKEVHKYIYRKIGPKDVRQISVVILSEIVFSLWLLKVLRFRNDSCWGRATLDS